MKRTWFRSSMRALAVAVASLGGAALLATSASALVLNDKTDAQKLRKDIGKQQAKLVDCLVKAALKCEKSGDQINPPECDLSDGTATPPADDPPKFVAAIAKCESKVDYTKKSFGDVATDYDAIGCPGDSDSGTAGDQPYDDLLDYQAGAAASAKTQIDTLAAVLAGAAANPAVCGSEPTPKDQNKCGIAVAKRTGDYAKGIFKCFGLCENDYKNKKGNGGGTDGTNCALNADGSTPNTAGDPLFNACVDKARGKAEKKGGFPGPLAGVVPLLHTALNDANNDLFNENETCP